MPNLNLSQRQSAAIARYLYSLPSPKPQEGSTLTTRPTLTLLKRRVEYSEVKAKVLGKICIHCHMDPRVNQGEGGAGNTGGLGFVGAGLNLESYEGLRAGIRRGSQRISILESDTPGQQPLLMEVLLRRFDEQDQPHLLKRRGKKSKHTLGMPMGLPPLPLEDLNIVFTWLKQGAGG